MKTSLTIAAIALSLTACSSMQELKTENINKREVPSWYLEHADSGKEMDGLKFWDRKGVYYAVAEDVSPSMEMAMKKATLKAKAKLIDRVNGEMNNRTTMTYNEAGGAEDVRGRQASQDVIVNLIAESVLRTYGLDKKMVVYNPEMQHYRAFVLMKISQKDIQEMARTFDENKQVKLQNRVAGKTVDETATEVLEQSRK
jgi:hypothetical protein